MNRLWVMLATIAVLGAPSAAHAQTPASSYRLWTDARCGDAGGDAVIAAAIALRLPELTRTDALGPDTVEINWRPVDNRCVVEVVSLDGELTTLPMPIAPDAATLDEASARIAWLALAASGLDPFSAPEEPTPAPALPAVQEVPKPPPTAPPEPVEKPPIPVAAEPVAPPTTRQQVGVGASLIPSVYVPARADENTIRAFSINLFGGEHGGLRGYELSLGINLSGGDIIGIQQALVANHAAGALQGFQSSLFYNHAGADSRGVQFGAYNRVRGDVVGAQLGLFNAADGDVAGVQLGLVNVVGDSTASIGLVNIVRDAPVHFEVIGSSARSLEVGVRHGSTWVQNTLMVGAVGVGSAPQFALSYGVGGHIPFGRTFLDVDFITSVLFGAYENTNTRSRGFSGVLLRPRVSFGVQLSRRSAFLIGLSPAALFPQGNTDYGLPTFGATTTTRTSGQRVYGWPVLHAGLRL